MEENIDYFAVLKNFNKEEILEEVHPVDYCKNCKNDSIQTIRGEYICTLCSITYGSVIDSTQEWRSFADDSRSSDPNRCGMPSNPLFQDLSSCIDQSCICA